MAFTEERADEIREMCESGDAKTLALEAKVLIEILDFTYPVIPIAPCMDKDIIMYNAGQRSVVNNLLETIRQS